MIRFEMKNYNTILTVKHQKYQHHYQVKLTKMNISQGKKYYPLENSNDRTMQIYIFFFRRTFGNQIKKQIGALKPFNCFNKIYELK